MQSQQRQYSPSKPPSAVKATTPTPTKRTDRNRPGTYHAELAGKAERERKRMEFLARVGARVHADGGEAFDRVMAALENRV